MRREYGIIQNVRHLHDVTGKPDVGKSCQGQAIKVNARESYDSPCSRSSVDGPKHRHFSPHASYFIVPVMPLSKKVCSRNSLSTNNGSTVA